MPTVCTPGGSYSRTTSSPRRALDRQWMRRSGSPGRYSRTPNSSIPEPDARRRDAGLELSRLRHGAERCEARQHEADLSIRALAAKSEEARADRSTRAPSCSPRWRRARAGRASGARPSRDLGTTPVAAAHLDPADRCPTAAPDRASCRSWSSLSSMSAWSPSKIGAGSGPLRRSCSGSASSGESGPGLAPPSPRLAAQPAPVPPRVDVGDHDERADPVSEEEQPGDLGGRAVVKDGGRDRQRAEQAPGERCPISAASAAEAAARRPPPRRTSAALKRPRMPSRCDSTGSASSLMSSGSTKSRPSNSAQACAARCR